MKGVEESTIAYAYPIFDRVHFHQTRQLKLAVTNGQYIKWTRLLTLRMTRTLALVFYFAVHPYVNRSAEYVTGLARLGKRNRFYCQLISVPLSLFFNSNGTIARISALSSSINLRFIKLR